VVYLDRDDFCEQLSHTRNWLVHWGTKGKATVEDPGGLVILLRELELVLYVNLLLDLGLTAVEAERVVASGWRLQGLP
jgi:hypothetical protein